MKLVRPSFKSSATSGFTLIEIMVVVAIIGVTLSMGMPSFLRMMHREGLRKAEYDLLEACRDARRVAIMNGEVATLQFQPMDRTFEVPGGSPQAMLPNDIVIDILGVNFIQYEKADEATIHFYPNGTSDEFTIVVHEAGGKYIKISLDTVTALPEVSDIN